MDLFDPETWKMPAQLVESWKTIVTGGLALITAAGAVTKKGCELIGRAWAKLPGVRQTRVDLRIVSNDRATFWSVGILGTEQVTSFLGTFHVTNVSDTNVALLKFRFRGLNTEHHNLFGAQFDDDHGMSHRNLIPGRHMSQVDAHCILSSLPKKAREPFFIDVIFTDNFGDEHKVRSVRFEYRGP